MYDLRQLQINLSQFRFRHLNRLVLGRVHGEYKLII